MGCGKSKHGLPQDVQESSRLDDLPDRASQQTPPHRSSLPPMSRAAISRATQQRLGISHLPPLRSGRRGRITSITEEPSETLPDRAASTAEEPAAALRRLASSRRWASSISLGSRRSNSSFVEEPMSRSERERILAAVQAYAAKIALNNPTRRTAGSLSGSVAGSDFSQRPPPSTRSERWPGATSQRRSPPSRPGRTLRPEQIVRPEQTLRPEQMREGFETSRMKLSPDEDRRRAGGLDLSRQSQGRPSSSQDGRQRVEAVEMSNRLQRRPGSSQQDGQRAQATDISRRPSREPGSSQDDRQRTQAMEISRRPPTEAGSSQDESKRVETLYTSTKLVSGQRILQDDLQRPPAPDTQRAAALDISRLLLADSLTQGKERQPIPTTTTQRSRLGFARRRQVEAASLSSTPSPERQMLAKPNYDHAPSCRCLVCAPDSYENGLLKFEWIDPCQPGCLCPHCMRDHSPPPEPCLNGGHKLAQPSWCGNLSCPCKIGCLLSTCSRCYPNAPRNGGSAKAKRPSGRRLADRGRNRDRDRGGGSSSKSTK